MVRPERTGKVVGPGKEKTECFGKVKIELVNASPVDELGETTLEHVFNTAVTQILGKRLTYAELAGKGEEKRDSFEASDKRDR
jgi:hypothetical protein